MAVCDVRKGQCSTELGEAIAMCKGIRTSMEAGFRAFILETDCIAITDTVRRRMDDTSLGNVIKDICLILDQCDVKYLSPLPILGDMGIGLPMF
ncbi:Aspartate carbamoyltransferase [Bienertia sinuspersici]